MTKAIRYGIQGGPGSFNESAFYLHRVCHPDKSYELIYLDTTSNVLDSLHNGQIDQGQFALFNSYAGPYDESLSAIGKYNFKPLQYHKLPIKHVMMVLQDVSIDEVSVIVSNPEVFKHCKKQLAERFSRLQIAFGEGELTDPARAAEALVQGKLSRSTAIVSNALIAEKLGLKIIARDLQDVDCESTFLVVEQWAG